MYCPSPAWGLSPSWVLMVPGRPGPGLGAQPCPRLPGRHMRGTCAGTVPRRVADSANGPLPQQEPRSRALPGGTPGVTAARSQGGRAFPWTLPSSEGLSTGPVALWPTQKTVSSRKQLFPTLRSPNPTRLPQFPRQYIPVCEVITRSFVGKGVLTETLPSCH